MSAAAQNPNTLSEAEVSEHEAEREREEQKAAEDVYEIARAFHTLMHVSKKEQLKEVIDKIRELFDKMLSANLPAASDKVWEQVIDEASKVGNLSIIHRKFVIGMLDFFEAFRKLYQKSEQNSPIHPGDTLTYKGKKITVLEIDVDLCKTDHGTFSTDSLGSVLVKRDSKLQAFFNSCTTEAVTAAFLAVEQLFWNYLKSDPPLNRDAWKDLKKKNQCSKDAEPLKFYLYSGMFAFLSLADTGWMAWESNKCIIPGCSVLYYVDAKSAEVKHAKVTAEDGSSINMDGFGTVSKTLLGKKLFYSEEEATYHKKALGKNN